MTAPVEVRTTEVRLAPDPSRVVLGLFIPGQEFAGLEDPTPTGLVRRILDLAPDEIEAGLAGVVEQFRDRHDDLEDVLLEHGRLMVEWSNAGDALGRDRTMLLGAAFTKEQSIEAASLCNPAAVASPDQSGVAPGELAIVLSVRGIAEGHVSSIGFRSGVISADGAVSIAAPEKHPVRATVRPGPYERDAFHQHLRLLGQDGHSAASALDALPERFGAADLDRALRRLRSRWDNPVAAGHAAERIQAFGSRSYTATFSPSTALARRVLLPAGHFEGHGMEDARFVRFEEAGDVRYLASYTAYDGHAISQQLLETTDFLSFRSTPLLGPAAANKGLALFPRKVGGRYLALSRFDRESSHVAYSDNLRWWDGAVRLESRDALWSVVQAGNCGSPIETEAGWLVLTHGVGPLRSYAIGAMLLDLDEPQRLIGELDRPLITWPPAERDGYVPNVVYSCGAVVHGGHLVVPYGVADTTIGVSTVDLDSLLTALLAG